MHALERDALLCDDSGQPLWHVHTVLGGIHSVDVHGQQLISCVAQPLARRGVHRQHASFGIVNEDGVAGAVEEVPVSSLAVFQRYLSLLAKGDVVRGDQEPLLPLYGGVAHGLLDPEEAARLVARPPLEEVRALLCRLFWVEQTMRHATIEGQERLLVTTNDITLRQQGEIALEDSERRYRNLFDSAGDAIFIHDTEGRMLAVNATACERLGYTRNELLAMNIDAVDAPGQGAQVPERMTRIIAQERIAFESVHRRKDGSLVPTELNAQLITWEGRPAVMSIARDITERRRMEEALVRSSRTQGILNDVFRLSLEDLDLTALLQRTIDQMLTIPWLELLPRGAIFLAEGRTLRLMAHRGLAKPLLRACASVDFGRCLCGRAALTGEFVFVDHLDERHETAYEGMAPHGHYCVPILSAGEVMGVVCLYLPPGHEAQPGEREVLEAVASALAGILRRRRAEEALLESAVALRRTVDGAVAAMGALVETRDPYTAGHERRVTELAVALGAEMGLGADTLETLRLASAVHDIGKVAVPAVYTHLTLP